MKTIQDFVIEINAKFPKTEPYQQSFVYTEGKKFYKICRSSDGIKPSSSYGFVDKTTGDLYKAASWNAPANYVRGNINDDSGLAACEKYSVKYLK